MGVDSFDEDGELVLVLHEHEEEEEPRRLEYRPRSKCSPFLAAFFSGFFSCAASKQRGTSGVKQGPGGWHYPLLYAIQ